IAAGMWRGATADLSFAPTRAPGPRPPSPVHYGGDLSGQREKMRPDPLQVGEEHDAQAAVGLHVEQARHPLLGAAVKDLAASPRAHAHRPSLTVARGLSVARIMGGDYQPPYFCT